MAFPHQAEKMNFTRIAALSLTLLLPLLSLVRAEPDALIRFADGSVVEIENRNAHMSNVIPELLMPPTNQLLPNAQHSISPARALADHKIETRSGKQHFCGELLVNALALVCKGNYKKRARSLASNNQMNPNSLPYDVDGSYFSDSLQSKSEGENMPEFYELIKAANGRQERQVPGLEDRQKNKRGVVDECCKKPCSTATLSAYCSR